MKHADENVCTLSAVAGKIPVQLVLKTYSRQNKDTKNRYVLISKL